MSIQPRGYGTVTFPDPSASLLEPKLADFGIELVQRQVGAGGSAIVHQGVVRVANDRFPPVGTPVALKQYKPELFEREGQLKRIQQEADLGLTFDSPNVVKTYGLLPSVDRPEFLVMEWIDGGTLEQWSARSDGITWERLQSTALALVSGLEHMHSRGVYHRDLKPENVMLRADGSPVIMDIGVAELTVDTAETLHTNVAQFLGSMRYASPQYLMGEKFVAADDIYGIGTILFELFTGKRMFDGHERKAALPVFVAREGQRVESLREVVPAPLKLLLQAAIHRDRDRRPALADMRAALQDPAGSPFISTEIERQTAEERGYPVLKVLDDGLSFVADLGGADHYVGSKFTVVRRVDPLLVPSLSRRIVPEQWVASATLKHIFQNVGHFIVVSKRWQESTSGRGGGGLRAIMGGPDGQWVESEHLATNVRAGDWVLKPSR